jgi:hypothetical protein
MPLIKILQKSEKKPKNRGRYPSLNVQPGDWVRVRSREEILSTLDEKKRFQGCLFMDNMWQYCGGEYRVLKRVNHMLDEREIKMKKSKDIVISDGLICHGCWPYNECDRSCYLLWKGAWLEKIDGKEVHEV